MSSHFHKNNDRVKIPIGIKIDNTANSGTYVFDVQVWNNGPDDPNPDNNPFSVGDSQYSSPLKLYVEVP